MEELEEIIVDPLERTEHSNKRFPVWNNEESDYITQLWNDNVGKIGSQRGFISKKALYEHISRKLMEKFGVNRSPQQCEYKVLSIQRRTSNMILKRKKSKRISEEDTSDEGSSAHDNPKMSVRNRDNESDDESLRSSNIIAQTIRETMLEINSLKEQEKERRHREKIELLERFLDREVEKKPQVVKTSMTIREQLLESHRQKMAEKERRHREKLGLIQKLQYP